MTPQHAWSRATAVIAAVLAMPLMTGCLEIEVDGEGTVETDPGPSSQLGGGDYPPNTTIELNANPAGGWEFVRWEGDLTGSNPQATFTTPGMRVATITAVFEEIDYEEPEAAFSADPPSGPAPLEVSFTDQSQAGDNPMAAWEWQFGDGNGSEAQHPTHTYSEPGSYTVSLTVYDSADNNDQAETQITVEEPPPGPEAAFSADPRKAGWGTLVAFSDESLAGDTAIESWHWEFGDGETSSEENPLHTYEEAGEFDVTLTVTDHEGREDSVTEQDYITAMENWTREFGSDNERDIPTSVINTDDGFAVLALSIGGTPGPLSVNVVLRELDRGGALGNTIAFERPLELVTSVVERQDGDGFVFAGGDGVTPMTFFRLDEDGERDVEMEVTQSAEGFFPVSVQLAADDGYVFSGAVIPGFFSTGDAKLTDNGNGNNANDGLNGSGDLPYVVKTDETGAFRWDTTLDDVLTWGAGFAVERLTPVSLENTSDGGYILATTRLNDPGGAAAVMYLQKLDGGGDREWSRGMNISQDTSAFSVRQTEDGGFILAGAENLAASLDTPGNNNGYKHNKGEPEQKQGGPPTPTTVLVKTDEQGETKMGGKAGDPTWVRFHPQFGASTALSVEQTADGGFLVAVGAVDTFAGYLLKTDAQGFEEWSRPLDGWPLSLKETPDGGFVLTGMKFPSQDTSNVFVTKTDHEGRIPSEE